MVGLQTLRPACGTGITGWDSGWPIAVPALFNMVAPHHM